MGDDVRLKQLVSSLKSSQCDLETAANDSLSYIREGGGGEKAHSYLCAALLQREGVGGKSCSNLLNCLGPAPALLSAHANLPRVTVSNARWLARELESLVHISTLTSLLCRESCSSSPTLSPIQQQLLSSLTHLPDLLANRLGSSLPPSLLPTSLFTLLGCALLASLHSVHSDVKGGEDRSLAFLGAVLSKAAILGQTRTMLSQLVPVLQHKSQDDPLWRRVCHSLFCRVSSLAMEPLLVEMVQLLPPSLANPHPLYLLLGDLATTNQKARHVFSHKLWLARLPSNENAAYNLIGYLMSWEAGQDLLGQSLRSAMGVWSEGGAVRRMDGRQHMWLCRLLVLGTTCLASHLTPPTSTVLKEGVMRGLQSHLDTAVPGVRERGMATGQCLMNTLHSRPTEQLHFDLGENPEVESILQLAEPVAEQQERLCGNLPPTPPPPPLSPLHEGREESCASGLVRVTEAGDSDSDDDLEPYDMSHDPDNSRTPPPRYLLDCLSVLVSPTERGPVEAALSSLPSLVSREPSDLSEVCVDLGRALIHLQDSWDLPSFPALRHSALVSLTTARPRLLAPFLVTEFYSPNHNLRQRLDILEVISSGATQLSSPSTDVTPSPSPPPPTPGKPWQQQVEERLKAKTRIISKGPRVPPPTATPSRFSAVAPLFFYPLIAPYDRALPSLDLLGRDSLLLGHLVRVLGNVVWCACHAPCQPAMARSLLEFLWAVRYHNSSFVRQAVLCALNMAVVATPTNYLLTDMHEALAETMLWVQDVSISDGDDDVRALAARSLSILAQVTGENT